MAGSSGTIAIGNEGTGLPGPMLSIVKELSSLDCFDKTDDRGRKELSVIVSKLFNGTLLGERDSNGKIIKAKRFDLRTEIGITHYAAKQTLPVVVNECIVRSFFFFRRLYKSLMANPEKSISEFRYLPWDKILPRNNKILNRMLTISSGTMTIIDLADAAIESFMQSGGDKLSFATGMLARINIVGVGRFVFALGADVIGVDGKSLKDGIKRMTVSSGIEDYMIRLMDNIENLNAHLSNFNAKMYYNNAGIWNVIGTVFVNLSKRFYGPLGCLAAYYVYAQLSKSLAEYKYAKEERIRIEKECEEE